jgi:threonine dehydratase
MPENSAQIKKAAVQGLGATVRFCAPTLEARDTTCAAVQAETGALLVHPYDDWRVIAGQGTAALELLEEIPDLDAVITPVGGGALLSRTEVVPQDQAVDPVTAPSPRAPRRLRVVARPTASSRATVRARSPTVAPRSG